MHTRGPVPPDRLPQAMKNLIADAPSATRKSTFTSLERFARRMLFTQLSSLRGGSVTVIDGSGRSRLGSSDGGVHATVRVHDPAFYADVLAGGSVGAGESYMRGHWDTDDLVALVRLFVQNMALLDRMETGLARLSAPARHAFHWLHRNTRRGARRNISAHYDLGNDFFALFLDREMMYSSAYYERADSDLEAAARAKLDLVCRKLALSSEDHLLEIGTGWGGLAIHAARHYGCRVTTTTISKEQFALAEKRIVDAGLSDRITLRLDDYRDLDGQYDKLVSIEMIEAIGHRQLGTFFDTAARLLKDDGIMLLQAITIADQRYAKALNAVDFIQRHIFPGSFLPSVTALADAATAASDLGIVHLQDIGAHYARTLHDWRARFHARAGQVRGLGYPETFLRMWDFYLAYCEGGFRERTISDVQLLLAKPGFRLAADSNMA